MTPQNAYRRQRSIGWTRADMLLALYDATIRHVDAALGAAAREDVQSQRHDRLRAARLVLEIFSGLDLNQGELPQRLAQLCEYMHFCLVGGDREQLESVRRILVSLREAYEAVREQAIQLEVAGTIRRLDDNPTAIVAETV